MMQDKQAGFSLLEIMLVMMMIAILSSLANISWQKVKQRQQLLQATLELATFLNEVQNRARWQNRNLYLHLIVQTESKQSGWCLVVTKEENPPTTECRQGLMYFIPADPQIQLLKIHATSKVAFYGRHDMAQTATLHLKNATAQSQVIIARRGRIRYCSVNADIYGLPVC